MIFNRLLLLSFECNAYIRCHKGKILSTVQIKDYNVKNERWNVFDQSVKNDERTYDSIPKITNRHEDYDTIACLLDYFYFKKKYKMIVIDLDKQQKLDADPKAIQITGYVDGN